MCALQAAKIVVNFHTTTLAKCVTRWQGRGSTITEGRRDTPCLVTHAGPNGRAECRSNLVRKNRRTIAADENKSCRSAMQFQPHSFLSTVVSFLIIILLLLPASSSTPSTLYTLYPPTDNSWIRPSTSPVLTASQPWEGISAGSFAQDRFSADTRDAL